MKEIKSKDLQQFLKIITSITNNLSGVAWDYDEKPPVWSERKAYDHKPEKKIVDILWGAHCYEGDKDDGWGVNFQPPESAMSWFLQNQDLVKEGCNNLLISRGGGHSEEGYTTNKDTLRITTLPIPDGGLLCRLHTLRWNDSGGGSYDGNYSQESSRSVKTFILEWK